VKPAVPQAVPDLSFTGADGKPHLLSEWRGKLVLLNVWATWCAPCKVEMPSLDRLQAKLGGGTFAVLALSVDRTGIEKPAAFFSGNGITHLAVYNGSESAATAALRGVRPAGLGDIGQPRARGSPADRPRRLGQPATIAKVERSSRPMAARASEAGRELTPVCRSLASRLPARIACQSGMIRPCPVLRPESRERNAFLIGRNDAVPAITDGICPKSNLTSQIRLNLRSAINRLRGRREKAICLDSRFLYGSCSARRLQV